MDIATLHLSRNIPEFRRQVDNFKQRAERIEFTACYHRFSDECHANHTECVNNTMLLVLPISQM